MTVFYQFNSINNNVFFDVDKLKGFVNSSQSSLSILFWSIIYYLMTAGLIYVVNESREIINLELLKSNFLISGAFSVFFGLLSTINSIFSFVTYYYLGLNKFPMSTLTSVEGNTWRGIAPSAEAFGEFYAFVILFTIVLAVYLKLKITNIQIFLLLIYFYLNSHGVRFNSFYLIAILYKYTAILAVYFFNTFYRDYKSLTSQ